MASSSTSKPPRFDLSSIIRPNILSLHPYRCARDDYSSGILLDANENALGHSIPTTSSPSTNGNGVAVGEGELDDRELDEMSLHRYPDPAQVEIKKRIAKLRCLKGSDGNGGEGLGGSDQVFLGVGSDEVIDLLFRVACVPAKDKVLICPPTYGMYSVTAQVNDVQVIKAPLQVPPPTPSHPYTPSTDFQPDLPLISKILRQDRLDHTSSPTTTGRIKLIFLCSPGNPTGTLIPLDTVREILSNPDFDGLVVVDEAYIDFCDGGALEEGEGEGEGMSGGEVGRGGGGGGGRNSAVRLLVEEGWQNLVVMQTLSKGFGLAAIRLGLAISTPPLIQILSNTKAPYNISTPSAHLALRALSQPGLNSMRKKVKQIISNRSFLISSLVELRTKKGVEGVGNIIGGNHANFILLQILSSAGGEEPDSDRANKVYKVLAEEKGVVVRFRGNELGCKGCLRVTIGTREECGVVLRRLEEVLKVIK